MSVKKDAAEFDEWKEWHDAVKNQLEKLLPNKAEMERTFHLGKEMPWGHLDSVYAVLLGARRLVLIFSNKETNWGDGKKRTLATEYLAQILLQIMSKPLTVNALFLHNIDELEQKLRQAEIL